MLRALLVTIVMLTASTAQAWGDFEEFGGFNRELSFQQRFFSEPDQVIQRPRVVIDQFVIPGRQFVEQRRVFEVNRQFRSFQYQDDFRIQPFPFSRGGYVRQFGYGGGCGGGRRGLLDLQIGGGRLLSLGILR